MIVSRMWNPMLLQSDQTLQELLVVVASSHPNLTAAEFHAHIAKSYRRCSLKAIYKALSQLDDAGVMVKVGKRYNLKLPWVMDLAKLVTTMESTYLQATANEIALAPTKKRQKWKFSNIAQMDRFWTQLLVALVRQSSSRTMFDYVPHPWFLLIHHSTEGQFLKALDALNCTFYRMVGGRTWLDTQAEAFWKPSRSMRWSFAPGPFEHLRRLHVGAIDDFVLEIEIDAKQADEIDALYDRVKSFRDVDLQSITRIFSASAKAQIVLKHAPKEARSIIRKHAEFFGLSKRKIGNERSSDR